MSAFVTPVMAAVCVTAVTLALRGLLLRRLGAYDHRGHSSHDRWYDFTGVGIAIAITPILTALGIGGLAVALALQDALSNLFAGIHLLADKIIRVGDFVKLDTGVDGFVEDIGWRTRIRALFDGAEVVVPEPEMSPNGQARS